MGLLLIGCVSAYYCVQEEDNVSVKNFKSTINLMALDQDIKEHELTREAFNLKLKYFHLCNNGE